MENIKPKALFDFFQHISTQYNIQIAIHDFTGVVTGNPGFSRTLYPFLIHKNNFCMYIKSNKNLFNRCLCKRENIARKCYKMKQGFFGMCYAGVEEFVIPVFHNDELVLVIFAGSFRQHPESALYRISKLAQSHDLKYETLLQHYYESFSSSVPQIETIRNLLSIAAQYLEYIYAELCSKQKHTKTTSSSDYVWIHAIEFINNNYQEPLFVRQIAEYCHCSESHINHIFKRKMKMNINRYINQLRIEAAKQYLLESDMTIKNIASVVGFNDPNYFSKVFYDLCGVFPTKYRQE